MLSYLNFQMAINWILMNLIFILCLNDHKTDFSPLPIKIGNKSNHALASSATKILSEEQLQSISLPILIIAGGEDPIFQIDHAQKMANTFPNATFHIIEDLGHVLNPLCFDEIVSVLLMHTKNLRNFI